MGILKANLRHLYQRRGLWLAYVFLACFVLVSIMVPRDDPTGGQGRFIGLVVLAFVVGLLAATVQMEILSKPFAFGLPGYRHTVRRFIFSIGVVINMLGCLLFLMYPGVPAGYVSVLLASAFCAGLIIYLAGVWVAFGSGQPLAFIGFLVMLFFTSRLLNLHVWLEKTIVEKPLPVVSLSLLVAGGMWLYLKADSVSRRNCLRPFFGFDMAFNQERMQRSQRMKGEAYYWRKLKDHPRDWVEIWFLRQMNRHSSDSSVRFAWGSLYTTYAVALSRWKNILFVMLFLSVFLGYTGGRTEYRVGPVQTGVFIVPLILLMQTRPPLYSAMLIAGGRDQRLISTLVTAVVSWLLVALVFGSVPLISVPLAMVLPDLHYQRLSLEYKAVGPQILYVLVFLPLVYILQLVFFKKPVAMMVAFIAMLYLVMFISLAGQRGSSIPLSLDGAAALALVLWACFAGVLHQIARNRSLVR
jgi:hypothetical protein